VAALILRNYWALVIGTAVQRLVRLPYSSMITPFCYMITPFCPRPTLGAWRELVGFSSWAWMPRRKVPAINDQEEGNHPGMEIRDWMVTWGLLRHDARALAARLMHLTQRKYDESGVNPVMPIWILRARQGVCKPSRKPHPITWRMRCPV
jgi:hypothetical protein